MEKKILGSREMKEMLESVCREIKLDIKLENLVIIGIHRRGAILADRLQKILSSGEDSGREVPAGYLDITLYRDDFSRIGAHPLLRGTDILFDIDGKDVLLIDDVLYTGRTIRAALDAIIDLGRPSAVKLFVLIDRGCRELPISADYVGRRLTVGKQDMVEVRVKEIDKKDEVVIQPK